MPKTKEVEIEGEKFTIRRWTIRERCKIWDSSTEEIDPASGRITRLNSEKFTVSALAFGTESPKMTEEQAGNLDSKAGQQLLREILELNEIPLPLPEISRPISPDG